MAISRIMASTIEDRLTSLEKAVDRLERIIRDMVPKNEQWVKATVVTQKTGWDKEDLRRARRNGSIKYKIAHTGKQHTYKYLLSSIIT